MADDKFELWCDLKKVMTHLSTIIRRNSYKIKISIFMSDLNTPSSSPKKARRYSEMTIDSKLTFSTRD